MDNQDDIHNQNNEHPLTKVTDPADPWRCQSNTPNGQCWNRAVIEGKSCMMHGGGNQLKIQEKASLDMYLVDTFKARIARQKSHPESRSLANEIAVLRMTLEMKLNSCETDSDLVLAAASIGDLVLKIDKVVNSCHKLERNMGQHLDKAILLQFAGEVVGLIGNTCKDKEEVRAIGDGIMDIIKNMGTDI